MFRCSALLLLRLLLPFNPECSMSHYCCPQGPNARSLLKGLGAYAYNVENTVLGSRGLDDWACEYHMLFLCFFPAVCVLVATQTGVIRPTFHFLLPLLTQPKKELPMYLQIKYSLFAEVGDQ